MADVRLDRLKNDGVNLSLYQTLQLIQHLEETSDILRSYLTEIDTDIEKTVAEKNKRGCSNTYLYKRWQSLFQNVTGTTTMIFTLVLQGVNLFIQTIIDFLPHRDSYDIVIVSCTTMILLQLLNLVLIISTSAKLARQMFKHHISGILLIQTYMATVLLFAGLYTVTKRLKPSSWKDLREDAADPVYIAIIYCKFLYFSVSTGTLCGSVEISPSDWYNCIFVSLQMLLSFMYFASILGHACMPRQQAKQDKLHSKLNSSRASSRIKSRMITPNHLSQGILSTEFTNNYGSLRERSINDEG